jgi:hypothetical protein
MKKLTVSTLADASAVVASTAYPFKAEFHKVVSCQAIWTSSTSSFTLTLQYSNDGGTTWANFATGQAVANNSGSVMWDVAGTKDGLDWQVAVTRASGTLTTLKVYLAYQAR